MPESLNDLTKAPAEAVADSVVPAVTPADTVELLDGTVLSGRLLESSPGSHVIIQLEDGTRRTLAWSQVKSVSETTADRKDPTLRHRSVVDCTEDPDQDRCTQTTDAHAGVKGVGVSYREERLSRVKSPPSYDVSRHLSLGLNFGSSLQDDVDMTIFGGTLTGGWRFVFGQLPGAEGGVFHGVGADISGAFSISSVGSEHFDGTMAAARFGGALGYQYYSFGPMNETTLEQPGFGVFVGYQFGGQVTTIEDGDGNEISSDGSSYHGPSLSLSWPTYNGGTADLTRWNVDILGIILEDFIFVTLGFGYMF